MVLTYRRTGGLFALFTLAAAALVATLLAVAVAGILLVVTAAIAVVVLLRRAVLPDRWRHRTMSRVTRGWPHETIDATVVHAARSSDPPRLRRVDGNTR